MRVKALMLLAIASMILLCTAGLALADDLSWLAGLPGLSGTSSVNLANGAKSYGFPALGGAPDALAPDVMMNWLSTSDANSLPNLGGTVPEALLTGAPIDDGMILTTGTTGLFVPDLAAQGLSVDASIDSILKQFSF